MGFKGDIGKWIIDNDECYINKKGIFVNVISNESKNVTYIAEIYGGDSEGKANALLISKAPEMLGMLNNVKGYLGSDVRERIEQLIKEATEL